MDYRNMPSTIDWRDLYYDEDAGYEEETIQWLSQRGPDVWHQCALELNWDWGWRIQGWICSQPKASVSTAAAVFWLSQPQELIDPTINADEIADPSSSYYLVKMIAENMLDGFYNRVQFPVLWDDDVEEKVALFRKTLSGNGDLASPWAAALENLPSLKVSRQNQLLSTEEFVEGIPREIYGDDI